MIKNDLEPAWLLHRRPFRNTSLIVELFLPDRGRVGVVARGGRRYPFLAPFSPLWVSLMRGNGELFTLRGIEPRDNPLSLIGRPMFCAFYVNELMVRLLHRDDPHPALWPVYEQTLTALTGDARSDVTLRRFEMALLEETGYGLTLDQDAEGQPLEPLRYYRWVTERGLVADVSGYSGALLIDLGRQHWTEEVRRTARTLLREALAPHLGDRPLRSRELFR